MMKRKRDLRAADTKRRAKDDSVTPAELLANESGNPFATFTEWFGEADEKAYCSL